MWLLRPYDCAHRISGAAFLGLCIAFVCDSFEGALGVSKVHFSAPSGSGSPTHARAAPTAAAVEVAAAAESVNDLRSQFLHYEGYEGSSRVAGGPSFSASRASGEVPGSPLDPVSPSRSPTGIPYYDGDSRDEEDSGESEGEGEGDALELQQEQQMGEGYGEGPFGLLRPQLSLQLVLWCILSGAIYFILKGATREDEKQKSLDVHKVMLRNTLQKLEADKTIVRSLESKLSEIRKEQQKLKGEATEIDRQLKDVVADLQEAAATAGLDGVTHVEEQPGKKLLHLQRGHTPKTSIALPGPLPGHDSACKENSTQLQLLLLNQGDTEHNESTVHRCFQLLKRSKQQQQQKQQKEKQQGQGELVDAAELAAPPSWYEDAVAEASLLPPADRPRGRIGSNRVLASSAQHHDHEQQQQQQQSKVRQKAQERKVALLAAAGVMLLRQQQLEVDLRGIRSQLQLLSADDEQQAKAAKEKCHNVMNLLQTVGATTREWLSRIDRLLLGDTKEEADARAVVRGVVATLDRVESTFRTRIYEEAFAGAVEVLGDPRWPLDGSSHRGGIVGVTLESFLGPHEWGWRGDAASEALKALDKAHETLCEQLQQLKRAEGLKCKEKKLDTFASMTKELALSLEAMGKAVGDLQQQQLTAAVQQQQHAVTAAAHLRREQSLLQALHQTNKWLENVKMIFEKKSESSAGSKN
ncbi:hypothetical protein, conserved [Eimeria tenella]|uniref:Uncharacterized protein n=1 Tax=Eimeria tenella TaxID=5802 RepID=U6L905_EIMTE|nr:hypothetical protein, conserved [Eimeria tenella]CDJ45019.1 hypothetical protein, conserved [Eimeria tenella]|eukprot:XP_013235766.1 hypothetical protein, conserved [Eimeria tenella]